MSTANTKKGHRCVLCGGGERRIPRRCLFYWLKRSLRIVGGGTSFICGPGRKKPPVVGRKNLSCRSRKHPPAEEVHCVYAFARMKKERKTSVKLLISQGGSILMTLEEEKSIASPRPEKALRGGRERVLGKAEGFLSAPAGREKECPLIRRHKKRKERRGWCPS